MSVVQTVGTVILRNGGRLSGRGSGAPVRSPVVSVEVAAFAVSSGTRRMSEQDTAGMVIWPRPDATVVDPMCRPPGMSGCDDATTL